MNKAEVLSKVRKLFELSNSPNENEAAAAAAKARELLCRHNLSLADLPAHEIRGAVSATERSVLVGKVVRNWMKGLLIHIARGFECEHIIRRRSDGPPVLTFIGAPADTEVALHTFQFLFRQLERLSTRALPRLKRENRGWSPVSLKYAYLDGAVTRIGERFREITREIRQVERHGCQDLIVVKEDMIADYMARTFPHIRTEYGRRRSVSAGAFHMGYRDAGTIAVRPAVTA